MIFFSICSENSEQPVIFIFPGIAWNLRRDNLEKIRRVALKLPQRYNLASDGEKHKPVHRASRNLKRWSIGSTWVKFFNSFTG